MSANVNQMNKDEMNKTEVNVPETDELCERKQQENKKQNKKAGVVFAVLMVISVLVGFFGGFFSHNISAYLEERNLTDAVGEVMTRMIGQISPFAIILIFVGSLIYSVIAYRKCKAKWDAQKDTNEDIYDELEGSLDNILGVGSLGMVISYGLFGAGFYYTIYAEETSRAFDWFLISILFFIAHVICTIVCQQKVIDFTKIMNPEKQGSVYDMKFQDKWYDSCDEMERAVIGQCAMKAYRVTQNLCVFLWLFFVIIAVVFEITLWPVVIVTLIWFVLNFTYLREAKKFARKNRTAK